jgi:HK97 gp10 family phage protein
MAEVDGSDEVIKKLRALPEKMGKRAMRRALRKGANVVRDAARSGARRLDDQHSPEQIFKNITVQGGGARFEKKEGGPVMRVGVKGGARTMTAYGEFKGAGKGNPGGDTWYWRLLEFGTSKIAARPFMRPAAENNAGAVFDAVAKSATVELDKEIKRL